MGFSDLFPDLLDAYEQMMKDFADKFLSLKDIFSQSCENKKNDS